MMPIRVSVPEARARFASLLDAVEAGEEVELTISGRVVARIVPATSQPHQLKSSMVGAARTAAADRDLYSAAGF